MKIKKSVSCPRLKIYNIKLSLVYNELAPPQVAPSPGVYKFHPFCATIYQSCKRRLINVTGVKQLQQIELIKKKIEREFNLTVSHVRIDNIFLARRCFLNFDIERLITTCEILFKPTHFIIYDILLFRGIYVIPRRKELPSFIVFRTGSFTVMLKQICDIERVEEDLKKIYTVENLKENKR